MTTSLTLNILDSYSPINTAGLSVTVTSLGVPTTINTNASPVFTVDRSTPFTITVTKNGYRTFNSLEVYPLNNSSLDFDINLVEDITDINSPEYLKPYPQTFYVKDACSYRVDFYNGSSSYGTIEWLINNEFVGQSGDFYSCDFRQPTQFQVKTLTTVTNPVCGCSGQPTVLFYAANGTIVVEFTDYSALQTTLDFDKSLNVFLQQVTPDLDLIISGTTAMLDNKYYRVVGETVFVEPAISLHNPCTATIKYSIQKPSGAFVSLVQDTFDASLNPSLISIDFVIDEIGDYKVIAELTDCCTTYITERIVETSSFLVILPTLTNNLYDITNYSTSIEVDYFIKDLEGVVLTSGHMLPLGSIEYAFDKDGTYLFVAKYIDMLNVEQEKTFIISTYDNLEQCVSNMIVKIFCNPDCECSPNKLDELRLHKIVALAQTFFMDINEEFSYNTIYSVLSDSKMKELIDRDQVHQRILSFCGDPDCKPCNCH